MPLVKQSGFKFSILCDVFLLISLTILTSIFKTVLCLDSSTEINTNNNININNNNYDNIKLLKRFDMNEYNNDYNKIPYDIIHRILRDEDIGYDKKYYQKRWKIDKSINLLKHSIKKRSSIDEIFNIKPENHNNNYSTKKTILQIINRNLTKFNDLNYLKTATTIRNYNNIIILNLTNNCINDFNMTNIEKLENLKILDLSKNRIQNFTLNTTIIRNLTILNLSSNQVSNFIINTNLIRNNKLKILYLNNNNINFIDNFNLSKLNLLEILDLSCNEINDLKRNFFDQMKSLKRLNLSHNRLLSIFKEPFYNLLNLDTLILSYNNISFIDYETFLVLPNLQYLDLSYNNLKSNTIKSLQGIPDLIGLSIAYNPDLGDSLQEFVASWSLKELDASGTGLCQIPAALAQSVQILKLMDNWFQIIRCGDLDSYPLLQYLDLSSSHIDEIEDDALGRLEILQTLFLDHNNLKHVPVSLPTSLENLFLHHNNIMDILPQTFQHLNNLKTLDLSENKLMYLPGLPLPKLLILNLQSCELKGLSQTVVKTSPKLRDLLLDGNPIKCSDLLGIVEWASPCQWQHHIEERKNLKKRYEIVHNYYETFQNSSIYNEICIRNDFEMKRNYIIIKPNCFQKIQKNMNLIEIQNTEEKLLENLRNFPPKNSTNNKNTALLNDYEKNTIKNIIFNMNSTTSSRNNYINKKNTRNGTETNLFHAKIPILSYNHNSSENLIILNVNTTTIRRRNDSVSFPFSSSLSSQNISKHEEIVEEEEHLNQVLSSDRKKSNNNYVETSILLSQKKNLQNTTTEKHFPIDENKIQENLFDIMPKKNDDSLKEIMAVTNKSIINLNIDIKTKLITTELPPTIVNINNNTISKNIKNISVIIERIWPTNNSILSTTLFPIIKSISSKINKSDKVIYNFDQKSIINENGIIKWNQSYPEFSHNIEDEKINQIVLKQMKKTGQQKNLKQGSNISFDHIKRYNPKSQQKLNLNNNNTIFDDDKMLITTIPTTMTSIPNEKINRKVQNLNRTELEKIPQNSDRNLKFSEEKNVTILTILPKLHKHKTINKDKYPIMKSLEDEFRNIKVLYKPQEKISSSSLMIMNNEQNTERTDDPKKTLNLVNHSLNTIKNTSNNDNIPLLPPFSTSALLSSQQEQMSKKHDDLTKPTLNNNSNHIQNNTIVTAADAFDLIEIHTNHTNITNSSTSNGLSPEQWLDIRTASGHPGLLIVIGITFGMLFTLGLIHIYRCRRPSSCHQNHLNHNHSQQHHHHNHHHHNSREYTTTNDDSIYRNDGDDYYIEVDQESETPTRRHDFLPMELLNSNVLQSTTTHHDNRQLDIW